MRFALALAALLVAFPAAAGPFDGYYCKLYPSKCAAPIVPAPVELEPAPLTVQPAPVAVPPPSVAAPIPVPRPRAAAPIVVHPKPATKPARVKSKFKKKRYTAAELAAMPGLPWYWPCAAIRNYAAGKTKAQLVADGHARRIALNPRQIKEVCNCGVEAACGSA